MSYPWESAGLLVARLGADGTVTAANAALERFAGRSLDGEAVDVLVARAQRGAFRHWLAAGGAGWRQGLFALQGATEPTGTDRAVWLQDSGDGLELVAEPAIGEQERLVEKVLELNADLLGAHRELVRQREELRATAERVRNLEAISSAGLAHARLDEVLDDLLRAIAAGVRAEWAAIRLGDDLRVEASIGQPGASVAHLGAGGTPYVDEHVAAMPLVLAGRVLGVLEVGSSGLGDEDLRLLVPAAERAAVAISRAQVHERERRIAETLQRALLPASLPDAEGISLEARFQPGADVDVGGDWYDALPLPSGEIALAIGDVAGKGVRAAATMGELRSALRAYALATGAPDEVLARLDTFIAPSDQMATVALAALDPATGALRYASAGHLPPLLVGVDDRTTLLWEGRAAPLPGYRSAGVGTARLERGDRLVLYTDGLVERRGESIDSGLDRLVHAAARHAGDAGLLCDALVESLHEDGGQHDDTAVIVVRRT